MPTTLAAAGNVEAPACLVLQSKGYRVARITADNERAGDELWTAEGNGFRFVASGPIELLGVVAVYEARGDSWRASDEALTAFMERFSPNAR
jgi:hypothetical protein